MNLNPVNLIKRVLSAVGGGGLVFAILYMGTRFDIQWIAGVILFPGGVDRTLPFTVFYGTASASFPGAQGDQTP